MFTHPKYEKDKYCLTSYILLLKSTLKYLKNDVFRFSSSHLWTKLHHFKDLLSMKICLELFPRLQMYYFREKLKATFTFKVLKQKKEIQKS
jgi:hypothetical protein